MSNPFSFLVLLLLFVSWTSLGAETPENWREVFAYCQETSVEFGADGAAVAVQREMVPPPPRESSAPPFDPDGEAARMAAGGDSARADAFLRWLDGEYAEAGETVLVAGTDAGGVYVLTEHGAAARGLKRYDMGSGESAWLTEPRDSRELAGPLFVPDNNGEMRLAALVWQSQEGAYTEWLEPSTEQVSPMPGHPSGGPRFVAAGCTALGRCIPAKSRGIGPDEAGPTQHGQNDVENAPAAVQACLGAAFPGAKFDWMVPSPDGGRWIVRARCRDRPPTWLEVDVSAASWRVVAECPVEVSPTERTIFRWTASDGMPLSGVFTRPDGPGPYPLVVFPHGGPGALSTTDFDERVWALADAGFAVFQPNYRGSAGLGKDFRFAGWGAAGIRRALLDVREGTAAILADADARLDGTLPVLFGGSWGGYVALAELAMFPEDWAGAVSFFGVFDLPELLRAEWARAGEGETAAAAERARRSLRRQFGDPASPEEMEALAALSPVNLAGAIRVPVILFHNHADCVIDFAQSERMAEVLCNAGKTVEFHAAEGTHGWSPSEEAELYASLVRRFRIWQEKARRELRTGDM